MIIERAVVFFKSTRITCSIFFIRDTRIFAHSFNTVEQNIKYPKPQTNRIFFRTIIPRVHKDCGTYHASLHTAKDAGGQAWSATTTRFVACL